MKTKNYLYLIIFIFLIAIWVYLYFSFNGERFIGKLNIKGTNSYVNLYQDKEFDWVTGITYEIIDENGDVIVNRHHLSGTTNPSEEIGSFSTEICDSIVYITAFEPNIVYVMHDFRTNLGFPHARMEESHKETSERGHVIFEKIKACNKSLIWNYTKRPN